jgi:hypothetical protein
MTAAAEATPDLSTKIKESGYTAHPLYLGYFREWTDTKSREKRSDILSRKLKKMVIDDYRVLIGSVAYIATTPIYLVS